MTWLHITQESSLSHCQAHAEGKEKGALVPDLLCGCSEAELLILYHGHFDLWTFFPAPISISFLPEVEVLEVIV